MYFAEQQLMNVQRSLDNKQRNHVHNLISVQCKHKTVRLETLIRLGLMDKKDAGANSSLEVNEELLQRKLYLQSGMSKQSLEVKTWLQDSPIWRDQTTKKTTEI